MRETGRGARAALAIFVLSSFAFAQPLFSILSRNAAFFVAHKSGPADILLLAAFLMIAPSLLLVLACWLAAKVSPRLSDFVAGLILCGLITLIILPLLRDARPLSWVLLVLLALTVSVAAAVSYFRFMNARTYVAYLSPALVVFPLLFFMNSEMHHLLAAHQTAAAAATNLRATPPIIMVVFDELPLAALMDEEHRIDRVRYPHFAELADGATWFRNATTVADSTVYALPALATGQYPSGERLASSVDYPETLFTLLQDSYDIRMFEPVTDLCPHSCGGCDVDEGSLGARYRQALTDVSLIYLHSILPTPLRNLLPSISMSWGGFNTPGSFEDDPMTQRALMQLRKDRALPFRRFVDTLRPTARPQFRFLHILLPHAPYQFHPSGKLYTLNPLVEGLTEDLWTSEERVVVRSYRRFLVQLQFVDTLLGELLQRLRSAGIYDNCLLIVTSDHGASFLPQQHRRALSTDNLGDIAPVPLLIKMPRQKQGTIDDRNVELVDVLPTVADALGFTIPWSVDGSSLLNPSAPERSTKLILQSGELQAFRTEGRSLFEPALQRKLNLFGSGSRNNGRLFAREPYSALWGRNPLELEVGGQLPWIAELDQAQWLENVDPASEYFPSNLRGRIQGDCKSDNYIAVAVNDRIEAVTSTRCGAGGVQFFWTLTPETAYRKGRNQIEFFLISGPLEKPVLQSIPYRAFKTYALNQDGSLRSEDGTRVPVLRGALDSYVDRVTLHDSSLELMGWAADTDRGAPAKYIVVFVNGRHFYSGYINRDRADVVAHFGNRALLRCGFYYHLPIKQLPDGKAPEIRIFGIAENDTAAELTYPPGMTW